MEIFAIKGNLRMANGMARVVSIMKKRMERSSTGEHSPKGDIMGKVSFIISPVE